jgi:hypothetical protein
MSTPIDQIRAAVAGGDYAAARRLFENYAEALRQRALSGKLDAASLQEVFELIDWTKQTALVHRSHLEARIQSLRERVYISRAYAPPRE